MIARRLHLQPRVARHGLAPSPSQGEGRGEGAHRVFDGLTLTQPLPGRHRSMKAFTLIEALATLALVAIVLPVTFQAISIATATASTAARKVEAVAMAEAKMAELLVTSAWESGTLEGDFTQSPSGEPLDVGDETANFRWTATLSDWTDATMQELALTVYWTHRGQEYSTTLTTLVIPEGVE